MVIIEMNPRVSRSSALASKATGFPIAKIAAKLAVGYTLDELDNDITRVTPASFEPTIDYVVTKMPRFTFEKFPGAEPTLTTAMKSVGEAMSIGRSFAESLQKALRSMVVGKDGAVDREELLIRLGEPRPDRLLAVAQALRYGAGLEEIATATRIDPWFLRQIADLVAAEEQLRRHGLPDDGFQLRRLKRLGFCDARLAELTGLEDAAVAEHRRDAGLVPVYKRIDTCAAEFPSLTPYLYSAYETGYAAAGGDPVVACEAWPSERDKVMILGGGPNRIGQGIEFDYCCVHAAYALSEAGLETVMVNCNPETVSTDYDTSDRLYFEPLTAEDVIEIARVEAAKGRLLGVIVQFGGQTPLKLSHALEAAGIPILGTSPDAIDLAEDRRRFQRLITELDLRQPMNGTAASAEQARAEAGRIGYPVLIRPSYVLGGRAMEIVHDEEQLDRYITSAVEVSGNNPVLIDSYLRDAIEVDVDAVCDGDEVHIAGVMEHIEEAGIHSGDSACALPPHSLSQDVVKRIGAQTEVLAKALGVVGLMNVQFAVQNGDIYILEVNPRASRTVPFVAKATGIPIAKIAARVMVGDKLSDFNLKQNGNGHVAVKEAVFPFARFPGVDVMLGPEMRSTGEVMGLDHDFARAFLKAQMGAGINLPSSGRVFVSVRDRDKEAITALAGSLSEMGFDLVATGGTARHLAAAGLAVEPIKKVYEGRPNIVDAMISGTIDLVFNTTEGAKAIADSFSLRRTALVHQIPYYTTLSGATAAVEAISALRSGQLEVAPLQSYFRGSF
jgi:carbamoyl-phosphate synthase large subunit